jgi:potassium channel subfamily K
MSRLTTINSIQVAMSLIANIALLLNMTRRLSFAIAQSITIVGWSISSFLLISLVAVASSSTSGFRLLPPENHALTQAFYYGMMAAGLYFIISVLMIMTVVGAWRGHYPKQFRLTMAQRTLMLQTIGFMMYLLLGALIFRYIEDWEYLDAVYWADFTLLTIGIGSDFVPKTHLGRSLLFPFAFGGIITVGLVIGSIRSLVLERGREKLQARFVEKKREKTLASLDHDNRTITVSWFKTYRFTEKGLTEDQRREQEFTIMRKIQSEATARHRWMSLAISTTAAFLLWIVGAAIFAQAEKPQGWTYFSALYFSYTSLLTIGYGDLQPTSNSGKPFFVFWTLLAIPTLTITISHMGDTVIKAFSNLTIWAGTITILPGEIGFKESLRQALHQITKGGEVGSDELRMDRPPGFLPHSEKMDDIVNSKREELEKTFLDRMAKHVEDEELDEAEKASAEGKIEERDQHLYFYVLMRELRAVMQDVMADTSKKYSYRDWAWYLKLIGQDEADPNLHRRPQVQPATGHRKDFGAADSGDDKQKWSWLGIRSPLMGTKSEPEWLAERLGNTLEQELKRIRRGGPASKIPISLDDLLKRRKEGSDCSDQDESKKSQ